jgi:flagellar motility protein MotE (MotC chaperone)
MTCIVINRDSNGSTVDTSELDDLNMNQKIQFLIELFEALHDELHTQVEELEERMEDFEIAQEKVKDLYESLEGGGVSLCDIGEILNWADHVRSI